MGLRPYLRRRRQLLRRPRRPRRPDVPPPPPLADGAARGGVTGGVGLDLTDPQVAEVEDARREDGIGAGLDGGREVLEPAGAAAGDDGNADRGADRPDHVEVVPVLGAVGVHRVEQDLARTELGRASRPCDGVDAGAPDVRRAW